jgi:CMP/dCMP kinase
MEKITIAIDGYSSCGKSTIAKALANKLGYSYIDTGAMYRATTLFMMRKNIVGQGNEISHQEIVNYLPEVVVSFQYNNETKKSETYLNGENVEAEIRTMAVSENVSKVSSIKEVRQKMVKLQQEMGEKKGVVMEGRDIGTAVFPDAELKVFMTADNEVRVQRRYDELHSKGQFVTREEVRKNLEERDYDDTHRAENPLRKADDAVILDNSDLNPQQQLDFVLRLINDMMLIRP